MNEPWRETVVTRVDHTEPERVLAQEREAESAAGEGIGGTPGEVKTNSRRRPRRKEVARLQKKQLQPQTKSLAVSSYDSSHATSSAAEVPVRKDKREQILAACDRCRKRKIKCEGTRPSCKTCERNDLPCVYAADPGLSQAATLKRKYESMRQEHAQNQQTLVDYASGSTTQLDVPVVAEAQDASAQSAALILEALASGSDQQSSMLLARIRLGERWQDVAESLSSQHANGSSTTSLPTKPAAADQAAASQSWLPKIFDRNYFNDVVHISCTSTTPQILSPGSLMQFHSFGNLPFSSAIPANHSPPHVQQEQQRNLFVPAWAMHSINGAKTADDPFETILADLRAEILSTHATQLSFCGSHVYIAALYSQTTFAAAPKLSQVVARITHSIKYHDAASTFTQHAIMYWYWSLLRWMLFPSLATYRDVPAIARPTPYQLFMAHPRSFDFVIIPGLRDKMCRAEYADLRWLTEGGVTLECEGVGEWICIDGGTGEVDLSPICKSHLGREESWSFGPSVRPLFRNVDAYIRVRPH